ncbi:MAG: Smr/MutS family protein [Treponema sp.]|jgi:DNA mismatch repair protein MutS2|nr:Smr/MutS family protein [Treponema sp.]
MDAKTLALLDYCRIRDTVAGFCASEEGRDALREREPFTDAAIIDALKDEAREWTVWLKSGAPAALAGWPPVSGIFRGLQTEGASVTPEDAYSLLLFCRSAEAFKAAAGSAGRNLPLPALAALAETLPSLQEPMTLIGAVIDNQGQLRNLPELRAIRAEIKRLGADIESSLKRYVTELRDMLQSPVPALRSGRQTLAVKAPHKNKVRGILHEVSQTAQTVYIEPEEIVRKNNGLAEAEFHLEREIRRIMRRLAENLAGFCPDFQTAWRVLTRLDGSLAAARWGVNERGTFAEDGGEALRLVQARHPLLGGKAVPIDLAFEGRRRILIITGPNAGGKTAALKTAALFALLNQSGFPVPAGSGTTLPVFSGVYADIGDAQSLDESLSTFSARMKNIASILARADGRTLALLDELGSGTDPEEGGALAFAILDALIEKKAFVLATTHHGALKNYAYSHPECANASVEFDPATLSPTYRVVTGVPGESRAIEIARKSDLEPSVIDKAESYLAGGQTDISALIRGLTERYAEADQMTALLRKRESHCAQQERALEEKTALLKEQESALGKTETREARRFLDEARKSLENLVRELREGEITREKTRAVKGFIAALEQAAEDAPVQDAGSPAEQAARQTGALCSGAEALLKPKNTPVTLLRRGDEKGIGPGEQSWVVQAGSLRLTVKEKDLSPVGKKRESRAVPPLVTIDFAESGAGQGGEPAFELRLLGMRQEEAVKALERQLDLAVIKGLRQFSIIHGKGNGVLQQAVRECLAKYPGVGEFHFARSEDGGAGKTWVTIGEGIPSGIQV